jgi:hypothetical protein
LIVDTRKEPPNTLHMKQVKFTETPHIIRCIYENIQVHSCNTILMGKIIRWIRDAEQSYCKKSMNLYKGNMSERTEKKYL